MIIPHSNSKKYNIIKLSNEILEYIKYEENIVFICIGTDRSTGDSLGPLVGTFLTKANCCYPVYGTLKNPVHANNLKETISVINSKYKNPYLIAIDACLGNENNIGNIEIKNKPLTPGSALNKNLPSVGDISITGIVNLSGNGIEFIVLQNTRLYEVYIMSEIISKGIIKATKKKVKQEYKTMKTI
ncbi:TPA: spore protease YyaC [Clostridium botulinum]|uniref:spore protease YyaC n=1 Tax=Clostridium sporogenes TaxID=1509 RepID=UPI000773EBAD|nr:spore protease YyaC [Clostridium sporogenes]AUM93863.1 spore protease YyaC [Clostridium sporogenes]HBJ2613768.1 spore protease YyaC [Clostridium botulinum]